MLVSQDITLLHSIWIALPNKPFGQTKINQYLHYLEVDKKLGPRQIFERIFVLNIGGTFRGENGGKPKFLSEYLSELILNLSVSVCWKWSRGALNRWNCSEQSLSEPFCPLELTARF